MADEDRGEVEEVNLDVEPTTEKEEGSEETSDVILEGLEDVEDLEEEGEAKPAVEVDENAEFESMKGKYDKATKHITDLNKALSAERKKSKGKAPTQYSREQFKKILEESDGDPDTLLNVVQTMLTQEKQGMTEDVMSKVELSKAVSEADGMLNSRWPSLAEESSDIRIACNEQKEKFGLGEHPLGDLFGMSLLLMEGLPGLLKSEREKGRVESLGEGAEKKVKASVKANKVQTKGKGVASDATATKGELTVMKSLGIDPKGSAGKNYLKLRRGNKSVQTEED